MLSNLNAKLHYAVGILVLTFLSSGCMTYNAATDRNEFIYISTSQEKSMGDSYHQKIASSEKLITSGPEFDRLNRIGQKLVRVSDRQDYPYHFYLIDKDEINAFTVPGGYIYFYTGLFRQLNSDDAIAAVLAHEIGHCSAKHVVKKFQASQNYSWGKTIVLDIVSLKMPQASLLKTLGSLSADGIMTLSMSAYGRRDELEADRLGIKYLHLAHYDLNGMIHVFEVMQAKSPRNQMPVFLRSHPLTSERIKAAQEIMRETK